MILITVNHIAVGDFDENRRFELIKPLFYRVFQVRFDILFSYISVITITTSWKTKYVIPYRFYIE